MTALAAHRTPVFRNDSKPTLGAGLIETSAVVFIGSLLVADQTTSLLKPAADIGAAGSTFAGICTGFIFNTAALNANGVDVGVTGNGTIQATWTTDVEVLLPCAASVTAADVGNTAYALDDEGSTDASTAGPAIGVFMPGHQEATLTAWVALGKVALPDAT